MNNNNRKKKNKLPVEEIILEDDEIEEEFDDNLIFDSKTSNFSLNIKIDRNNNIESSVISSTDQNNLLDNDNYSDKSNLFCPDNATKKDIIFKKRPLSAYNIYLREQMNIVINESSKEKMKIIAGNWSKLNIEERKYYQNLANNNKIEWEAHKQFNNPNIKNNKKKSLTGYNLFIQEKMLKEEYKGLKQNEKLSKIAQKWKDLSNDNKKYYNNQASDLKN